MGNRSAFPTNQSDCFLFEFLSIVMMGYEDEVLRFHHSPHIRGYLYNRWTASDSLRSHTVAKFWPCLMTPVAAAHKIYELSEHFLPSSRHSYELL